MGENRAPSSCYALFIVSLLLTGALSGRSVVAQEAEPDAELAGRIDRLIEQLDDDKFTIREKAEAELAAIGAAAMTKLVAALKSPAPERRERAEKLLQRIRERSSGLEYLMSVQRDDLGNANSAAVSPDGRFVYVSASTGQTAAVLRFDPVTKTLEHVQSITDGRDLLGASALRLSPDGRLVVAACGFGMCVVLLERDANKGTLAMIDVVRSDPAQGLELQRQSDAMFSPDGRFVYSLDRSGAVVVFQLTSERKLRHVQSFRDPESLLNASGIAFAPDGSYVYVAGADSSALNVFTRDAKTGELKRHQVLRDEQDGVKGFARVYGVCTSGDGRFVYTCSNRDHAVSVLERGDDGKLTLLQEFINDQGDLKGFVRGNEIILSPDGLSLYASGSESHSLACFDVDPKTGKLSFRASVQNEGTIAPAGDGATGLAVSPDGNFVFVTRSSANAVAVFERAATRP